MKTRNFVATKASVTFINTNTMRLPKLETIIIAVFFLSVLMWAVSKCSSQRAERRSTLSTEEKEDRPIRRDTIVVQPTPAPLTHVPTNPGEMASQTTPPPQTYTATPAPTTAPTLPGKTPVASTTTPQPAASVPAKPSTGTAPTKNKAESNASALYVTIEGLKMRKEPGLKGETIAKLKLDEKVYFLGKKSEFTQEINLGYETVTDHWVKVRTQSGKEGWVFGAGVHYYKMKRKGVME